MRTFVIKDCHGTNTKVKADGVRQLDYQFNVELVMREGEKEIVVASIPPSALLWAIDEENLVQNPDPPPYPQINMSKTRIACADDTLNKEQIEALIWKCLEDILDRMKL